MLLPITLFLYIIKYNWNEYYLSLITVLAGYPKKCFSMLLQAISVVYTLVSVFHLYFRIINVWILRGIENLIQRQTKTITCGYYC